MEFEWDFKRIYRITILVQFMKILLNRIALMVRPPYIQRVKFNVVGGNGFEKN